MHSGSLNHQSLSDLSQEELVERLKQGCESALTYWFNHYQPQLLAYALKKAKTEKDAHDLVQETFINSYKQIQLFRGNSSLMTWMMSILLHEIADYYRKKYAKKAIRTIPLSDYFLKKPLKDSSEVSDLVKQALARMLSKRKKLLLMKYVDELKVEEIAQELGRTFKSVEAELYRARESFKKIYANLAKKSE